MSLWPAREHVNVCNNLTMFFLPQLCSRFTKKHVYRLFLFSGLFCCWQQFHVSDINSYFIMYVKRCFRIKLYETYSQYWPIELHHDVTEGKAGEIIQKPMSSESWCVCGLQWMVVTLSFSQCEHLPLNCKITLCQDSWGFREKQQKALQKFLRLFSHPPVSNSVLFQAKKKKGNYKIQLIKLVIYNVIQTLLALLFFPCQLSFH